MKEKVVLAYSGGLDTTVIIPWLKENFDYEVICVCGNCGQAEELDGLEERALSSGASKLYIEDLTDEFCDDFIMPCVQAHAVYENKYLLGTSMARPVAATVTYGISAMKVWNWKIPLMSRIMSTCWFSAQHRRRLPKKAST